MSLKKRFSVICCTLGFFLCFISFCYFSVFASSSFQTDKFVVRKSGSSTASLDTKLVKDYINLCSDNFDSVDELQSVALSWVFYTIYNDGYSVLNSEALLLPDYYNCINVPFSSTVSEEFSGSEFNDSFLQVYFDIFTGKYDKVSINYDNSSNCSHLRDSTLQDYISLYYSLNGKSIPAFENYAYLWWKPTLVSLWNIGTPITCISGVQRDFSKYYISYEKFKQVFNGFLNLYNSNCNLSSKLNINTVSSSDFKDMIDSENTQYTPKNVIGKMSYRTDARWHDYYSGSTTQYYNYLSFYTSSNFSDGFTVVNGGDDMYTLFFYTDGTDTYYSRYQYHWVVNPLDPQYDSSGENITSWGTTLDLYYWDCLDSSESAALFKNFYKCVSCNNYSLQVKSNGYFEFLPHDNYSGYLSYKRGSTVSDLKYINITDICDLMSSDLSTSIKLTSISTHFKGDFSAHDSSCDLNGTCDYGYIASTSPIQFTYVMDTSRIPDNYYVTITGDTIYDYSITNLETGQSDTINNYITNNYIYVTNNNGGGSSGGSGGTGGNVTVGGKIDVDGTVSVDVNVNVNGGAGGTSFGDVNTDPMNDYLNSALDESSGFRAFLGDFFSFLPVELLVLLGIGLTFVIIGRIMGR